MKVVSLNNRLSGEVNYFRELRKNIIGINSAKYATIGGNFIPSENIGEVLNQGIDACVNWNDKVGEDFTYNLGLNITFTKNKLRKTNELSNIEDYRKEYWTTYQCHFWLAVTRFIRKRCGYCRASLSEFWELSVGDIAYADLNNDGMVDNNDQTRIGQSFQRLRWEWM